MINRELTKFNKAVAVLCTIFLFSLLYVFTARAESQFDPEYYAAPCPHRSPSPSTTMSNNSKTPDRSRPGVFFGCNPIFKVFCENRS